MIPRLCDHHCTKEPSALSPRERFLVKLFSHPPMTGDAIVILCGEDAKPRMEMAFRAFAEGGAPLIVCSGGLDDPPHLIGANGVRGALLGKGLAPDRIIVEDKSQNTKDQADAVVLLAIEREWKRLILVASSYHMPRAFLTFRKALDGMYTRHDEIRLVPLCSNQSSWAESPDGTSISRSALFALECQKVQEYGEMGHVATWQEGLDYLTVWESKP